MQHINEAISLTRDVDAVLIPAGSPLTLQEKNVVFVTQALGGSYTVNINGNLARIDGRDADALGFDVKNNDLADRTPTDGSIDENMVWDQMRTCYDPEIPINIVELGLIYGFEINSLESSNTFRIDVSMTLTAPGCGMGDILVMDVKDKVEQIPNVTEVNVELTFDPPWNQTMMSEAARLQTGMM